MTRRQKAIMNAASDLQVCITRDNAFRILSDLVDQAESGKLKEPLPVTYVGMNGSITASGSTPE